MIKTKRILGIMLSLLIVFVLVGCKEEKVNPEDVINDVYTTLSTLIPVDTTESIDLPNGLEDFDITISWSSDHESILSKAGIYVSPLSDTMVKLTATVTYKETEYPLDFDIEVKVSNEQQVVNAVIAQINQLPEDVFAKIDVVNYVNDAYNELTESQKALVTNYDVLLGALDEVAKFEVEVLISCLPEIITIFDKDDILAAKSAMDALTPGLQELVTNKAKLESAMTILTSLQAITENDIITEINNTVTQNMIVTDAGLTLPYTVLSIPIEWTSDRTDIIHNDGILVNRPIGSEVTVTLQATFPLYDGEKTYSLNVIVKTDDIDLFNDLLVESGASISYNDDQTVATILTTSSDGGIKNTFIPLKPFTTYKLVITLKASEAVTTNQFRLGVGVDTYYRDYMPENERTMSLTTDYVTYEYIFETSYDTSDVNIELIFNKSGLEIEITEFIFKVISIADEVQS